MKPPQACHAVSMSKGERKERPEIFFGGEKTLGGKKRICRLKT